MIKEQERESSRFVQQKSHHWSKYCLKRSVLKASFEGGEGRAVTESERKRIPAVDSREAKGTTTMVFSLKKGMQNILSSEEERRDLEGT